MAISSAMIWEVRTTGSDSNGGGFKEGATGTDFSQQDMAQVTYTDLVIGNPTTTQLTSAANPFGSTHVGNVINITGGTGFTTGRYEVISVAGSTATVDRSVGTAGSTGGTGNLGGALLSPGIAQSVVVTDNKVFVKSGTYSISSSSANVAGGRVNITVRCRWRGYQTTRGDATGTRPILQATTSMASNYIVTVGATTCFFENFVIDGNSQSSTRGLQAPSGTAEVWVYLVTVKNTTQLGLYIGNSGNTAFNCDAEGCSGTGAMFSTGGIFIGCCSTANSCPGFLSDSLIRGSRFALCISANNTSDSGHGFRYENSGSDVQGATINCTAYGNGGSGFSWNGSAAGGNVLINCISYGNSAFGYTISAGNFPVQLINSAYGNNTSGNTNGTTFIEYSSQTLTADPFTNAAGEDFTLNSTAGGGALLRGNGFPGIFPATISTTGSMDIGAAQAAAGGGANTFVFTENNCQISYTIRPKAI